MIKYFRFCDFNNHTYHLKKFFHLHFVLLKMHEYKKGLYGILFV